MPWSSSNKSKIRGVGRSAVVTIPVDAMAELGWDIGDKVRVEVLEGYLMLYRDDGGKKKVDRVVGGGVDTEVDTDREGDYR